MIARRAISPVFVGREAELSVLDETFERACEEGAAAVLLGGEAGVGKTRAIGRFAEAATTRDALVLTGNCVELSTEGLAYAPFTAALRQLVRDVGVEDVAALLPEGASRDLARLLPEFGRPDDDGETDTARARLFEQMLTLLERLAEKRPVVLVIEDVHWADRSSRDLIVFLTRNLRTAPVMLIASFRSDELHRAHPLRPVLAELGRLDTVVRVDLPRLSRDEVAQQMAAILERAPARSQVDSVYSRSEGIPLFVEALMEADEDCLPASLQDLIIGSIEKLPEPAQHVLRHVSAAKSSKVGHRLLAAVTGLAGPDLDNALRAAVTANVLVADAEGYAFRHALMREAVHDELLPGERARLHARFAEEIAKDRSLVPHGRGSIEIAHHWYHARNDERALVSAWEAAEKAAHALAYNEQVQLLERVLELWEKVPDAAERLNVDHTAVVLEALEAAFAVGEVEQGLKFAKGALAELDPERDPERVAQALVRRATLRSFKGRPGELEDLRRAESLVPEPTPPRAFVLSRLSTFLFLASKDIEEGQALNDEALRIARAHGDRQLEAELRINEALAESYLGDLEASLRILREVQAIALANDFHRATLRAMLNMTDALNHLGRSEEAIALGEEAVALARRYGRFRHQGVWLLGNIAEAYDALGRWDEALELTRSALATVPMRAVRGHMHLLQADIALKRGDDETAERILQEVGTVLGKADSAAQEIIPHARMQITLHLLRRELDAALEIAREVLSIPHLTAKAALTWPLLLVSERACDVAGDHPAVPAVRERIAHLAPRMFIQGPAAEAYRLHHAGAHDEAAAAWEAMKRPYPQAKSLLAAAATAARAGDREGVLVRLRAACRLAEPLRARPLLDEIEDLARRTGVTLADPEGADRADRFGLTPRELEVLRLVTEGRTNREIAEELFISAKTASVHVSNILTKLGVSTRVEAAAAAHRGRLFPAPAA
ncbi:ATP-binding protein [Bailinhaonella thermotolerans]|uniref:ATP-binding protein n=1 Tax=Bailinhaonella thermotolerans TaxID=1070861 RepID=UPI002413439A|nr:LuxR family transcriptional regulator [Bailinhaonella thermotolerans]